MSANELRYSAGLRVQEDKYQIVGVAAAYNTLSADLGGFREKIAPGAFTRALREKQDCRMLLNHDPNFICGRVKNGTLVLEDSAEGLRFTCQLDENQQWQRDLFSAIKRGDIDSCSFAFSVAPNGDSFERSTDERGKTFVCRTLRDVNLADCSCVTYPAYPNGTKVSARANQDERGPQGEVIPVSKEVRGPQGELIPVVPAEVRTRFEEQVAEDELRERYMKTSLF